MGEEDEGDSLGYGSGGGSSDGGFDGGIGLSSFVVREKMRVSSGSGGGYSEKRRDCRLWLVWRRGSWRVKVSWSEGGGE